MKTELMSNKVIEEIKVGLDVFLEIFKRKAYMIQDEIV